MCGSGHQNMIRLQCIIKRLSPITCSPGNLTKIFLHVQLYTVCTSQDFDRITQHAPISTWLCRFTDAFPQSRSCLTRFQQSGRFKVEYCDGKSLQAKYNFSNTCDYKHKLSALVSTIAFVITSDHVVWNSPTLFYRLLLTRNCYLIRNDG